MKKGNIANRTFCILLSAILVITMMPILSMMTFAEPTIAVLSNGRWEHQNNDGKGTNYVTMSVHDLDYYFVQTQDNQVFNYTVYLNAFKNDGANYAKINSVTLKSDNSYIPNESWTRTTSVGSGDSPNGAGLPGSVGSGNSDQKNNNNVQWACTYTFTGKGAVTYTPYWEISYTSGASDYFSKKTYNTTESGEPIKFTINVCDARELIRFTNLATEMVDDENSNLSIVQRAKLTTVLNTINQKNYCSGEIYFDQNEVNSYVNEIKKYLPADYSEVNSLVAEFNSLDKTLYDEQKYNSLSNYISLIDYSFMYDNQSVVDGYASYIKVSLKKLTQNPADYSEVDKLINKINLMNSSLYTQESWNNLMSVISSIDYDLVQSEQKIVDNYVISLNNAIDSLKNKYCDYTNLNQAILTSSNIVSPNDGRYTEESYSAFLSALEAAENVDKHLVIDTDGSNQLIIDNAANALNDALTSLAENKKPVITVTDGNGHTVAEFPVDNSDKDIIFSDIKDKIETPEIKQDEVFLGWQDQNGNMIKDDSVITSDIELVPVKEFDKIKPNESGNTLIIDRTESGSTIKGLKNEGNTVSDIVESFQNEGNQIIITKDNKPLAENELVGTGCVINCVSKLDSEVVYEQITVVLYGDLNGDGKIDEDDYWVLNRNAYDFENNLVRGTAYYTAADLDGDGALDGFDYWILNKHIRNVSLLDQTFTKA